MVVTRALAHLEGATRLAAWGLLGMAALIAVHLAPGIAGVLSREAALVAAAVLAAAAMRLPRRARRA